MSRESKTDQQLRIKRMAENDIDSVLSGLTNLSLHDEEKKGAVKVMEKETNADLVKAILPPGMTWDQFHESITVKLGATDTIYDVEKTQLYQLAMTYARLGEFSLLRQLLNIQIRQKAYYTSADLSYTNNMYSHVVYNVILDCIRAGNVDAVDFFNKFPFDHPDIGQSEYVVFSMPSLYMALSYTLESESAAMFHYVFEKYRRYEQPHSNRIKDLDESVGREMDNVIFNCVLMCGSTKTFNMVLGKMGRAWMEKAFNLTFSRTADAAEHLFRGCNFTGKPQSFDMFIMKQLKFVEPISLHVSRIPLECDEAAVRLYGPAFEATVLHIDKRISPNGFHICPFNIRSTFQGDGRNKKWTSTEHWSYWRNSVSYCYQNDGHPTSWSDAPKRAFFHCIVNPTYNTPAVVDDQVVVPTTPSSRKFENHEVLCVFHINYHADHTEDDADIPEDGVLLKRPDEKTEQTYEAYLVPFMRSDKAFKNRQRFDRPTIEMVATWNIVYHQKYKKGNPNMSPSEMLAKSDEFVYLANTDFYHYAKTFEKINIDNQSFTMVRVAFFDIAVSTYNRRMTRRIFNDRYAFVPILTRNPFDKWSDPKYDNEKFGERAKAHRQDMDELTQLLDKF